MHSTRGRYCMSAFTTPTGPASVTKLVTLSHRNTLVVPEIPSTRTWVRSDLDPNDYNPLDDLLPCVNSLFEALLQTPQTLLDL